MNSLEMLKSEEGQLNAVFACFGSAAQHGQFFEAALSEFLKVYNQICVKSLSLADLETVGSKLQKKTIGQLLTQFRKHVTVNSTDVSDCLNNALIQRNFLIHEFFLQRDQNFATEKGRMAMLSELVSIENNLKKATDMINGMRVALSRAVTEVDDESSGSQALFSIEVDIPETDQN